jgi:hypothetical protein
MKIRPGFGLTIVASITLAISNILLSIGLIDYLQLSEYQYLSINIPGFVIIGLIYISGIVMLIKGLIKMRKNSYKI